MARSSRSAPHGYAQMWDEKLVILVHRWVMGAKPRDSLIVDHVNGDRLDERKVDKLWMRGTPERGNRRAACRGATSLFAMHRASRTAG
jgi:hypothetical protein